MFHILLYLLLFNCANDATKPFDEGDDFNFDPRIIGGKPAAIREFPFQVSLQTIQDGHICGGSIVNAQFILTAAHCVKNAAPKNLLVRFGTSSLEKGGQQHKVCKTLAHMNYSRQRDDYDYDIALIKLCQPLKFSNDVLPAVLPTYDEQLNVGTTATVTGWGYYKESGPLARTLQQVHVTILDQSQCSTRYRRVAKVTGRMVCAGCAGKEGACDACQGDSGGPMVVKGRLVGVVSWGYGCARKEYPGVYTKVAKFVRWIKNKMAVL